MHIYKVRSYAYSFDVSEQGTPSFAALVCAARGTTLSLAETGDGDGVGDAVVMSDVDDVGELADEWEAVEELELLEVIVHPDSGVTRPSAATHRAKAFFMGILLELDRRTPA